jgi:hypothetical protein
VLVLMLILVLLLLTMAQALLPMDMDTDTDTRMATIAGMRTIAKTLSHRSARCASTPPPCRGSPLPMSSSVFLAKGIH